MISYYFETDLASTLQRNSHREDKTKIPEVGVRAAFKKLKVPSRDEGSDALFNVKIFVNGEFKIPSNDECHP